MQSGISNGGWGDPRWAEFYPTSAPTSEPAHAHDPYTPEPGVAPEPTYLELLAAEARANPVTNTQAVQPGYNLAYPESNANVLL